MKRLIIIINIALGGLLIFYGVNSALFYARTQSFSMAMILNVVLGTFVIIAALAFRKDMRWALVALPLVPLALSQSLRAVLNAFRAASIPASEGTAGGPAGCL